MERERECVCVCVCVRVCACGSWMKAAMRMVVVMTAVGMLGAEC